MSTAKIPSKEFDALREYILESEGQEVEVLVDGRHGGRPISVCLVGERGISGLTASELARAVNRYFEGQSERVRLRTQFYLRAYHDISGIFLQYRMSDHLLEMARDALEVPEQIMRLVKFLEEEPEATVEFRFGHDPDDPFEFVQFITSKDVDMAGCRITSQCSQNARPSFDFIWRVAGAFLESIIIDNHPITYGSTYAVNFMLEEENGVTYFRMHHKGQRFFSVEKDKLRGETS